MSHRRALPLLFLLLFAQSGCASGGLAAVGPLMTAVQAVADRSVERTVAADLSAAWAATVDALSRMAVSIQEADRSGEQWKLKGRGETVSVHAELTRVTPKMTKLSFRVEAGKLLADKKTGEEILKQIAARLDAPPVSAYGSPSEQALSALRQEVERLRVKMDERRAPPRQASDRVVSPGPTRIMVVPASAGVPTVTDLAATAALRVPTIESKRPDEPIAGAPQAVPDIMAAPLSPVERLRPVEAFAIKRAPDPSQAERTP